MIILGFTGTSRKLTNYQKEELRNKLVFKYTLNENLIKVHHGDCIEADTFFHNLIRELFPSTVIEGHPPENNYKRAYNKCDILWKPKPYLVRNKDIVNCSIRMIAIPFEEIEILRSGTWSTIRYARNLGMDIDIIYPTKRK